jgi:hypothetical protein
MERASGWFIGLGPSVARRAPHHMRRPYLKLKISASLGPESPSKQACSGPVFRAFGQPDGAPDRAALPLVSSPDCSRSRRMSAGAVAG